MNLLSIPPRVQEIMVRETSSIEGVLVDFPTPIISNIGGIPTRESLIDLHELVSGNVVSVASNLGGGRHRHLTLTTTSNKYTS